MEARKVVRSGCSRILQTSLSPRSAFLSRGTQQIFDGVRSTTKQPSNDLLVQGPLTKMRYPNLAFQRPRGGYPAQERDGQRTRRTRTSGQPLKLNWTSVTTDL